jgi:hypothetical protein
VCFGYSEDVGGGSEKMQKMKENARMAKVEKVAVLRPLGQGNIQGCT